MASRRYRQLVAAAAAAAAYCGAPGLRSHSTYRRAHNRTAAAAAAACVRRGPGPVAGRGPLLLPA
jgi:hypothetical protein